MQKIFFPSHPMPHEIVPIPQRSRSRKSAIYRLFVNLLIGCVVLVVGWYIVRSVLQTREENRVKREQEKSASERAKDEAALTNEQAIESYRKLLSEAFPGWELVGDDFNPHDLASETRLLISVHLRKGDKNRVANVILHQLRSGDGEFRDRNLHWVAYRPTALQLGNVELERVKKKEYESGQEDPPELDDYEQPEYP